MLATMDKAKSNAGSIRGLKLVAVKLTTVHVTKMPLLQKAIYPRGKNRKTVVRIKYEGWWVPDPVEILWIRNKFLIPVRRQPLNLPASILINILRVLISRNFFNTNCIKAGGSVHKWCLEYSLFSRFIVRSLNFLNSKHKTLSSGE